MDALANAATLVGSLPSMALVYGVYIYPHRYGRADMAYVGMSIALAYVGMSVALAHVYTFRCAG